ncbi:unnamed protein product [Bemisia tabaci]|uniref:ubiquitinyl hydrolase 1 n=1 Tax=Bemisia tabaci TaxID=7038 RepID=A0A9P0EYZ0_BEMTA|nr:PREDICTED: OTU domain-containing protein 5-A [Bemisia tabaci]CAH0382719.1 unnamed protein product [Bemisia tabaci]
MTILSKKKTHTSTDEKPDQNSHLGSSIVLKPLDGLSHSQILDSRACEERNPHVALEVDHNSLRRSKATSHRDCNEDAYTDSSCDCSDCERRAHKRRKQRRVDDDDHRYTSSDCDCSDCSYRLTKRRRRVGLSRTKNKVSLEGAKHTHTHTVSATVVSNSAEAGPSQNSYDGYNSEDEYDPLKGAEMDWAERDLMFEKLIMRKRGLVVKKMGEDGACMFRAVADQIYGDQELHRLIRNQCMDFIQANSEYYSQYLTENFTNYINRKRLDYTHGNHIELQAISELYNRKIEVYSYSHEPVHTFHTRAEANLESIRLSYQRGNHYNSLMDPRKPPISALPTFTPPIISNRNLVSVENQTTDSQLEQAMLEDKILATDWEATNEAIEEQVAKDSYLQWVQDNEKRRSAMLAASSIGSSTATARTFGSLTPPPSEVKSHTTASSSSKESGSSLIHENLLGLYDWGDSEILAQVMAASQQEYMDNLKKHAASSCMDESQSSSNPEGPSTSR